ncbi:putative ferric-chelate reductase 1 [Menidia menidia]
MEQVWILLLSSVMLFMAPGVQAQVSVNRTGCGLTKLCLETPDDCDPSGNSSCLFGSVAAGPHMPPNGVNLSFELSGQSPGYIGLGLTVNATVGSTRLFICGKRNETFFFRTMSRNNTNEMLTPENTTAVDVQGALSGDVIRCLFSVGGLNATALRSSHSTTFSVLLGRGNVTDDGVGPLVVVLSSDPLDLTNPGSNVNTTATPPTTSGAGGAPHAHAGLLLLLGFLALGLLPTL